MTDSSSLLSSTVQNTEEGESLSGRSSIEDHAHPDLRCGRPRPPRPPPWKDHAHPDLRCGRTRPPRPPIGPERQFILNSRQLLYFIFKIVSKSDNTSLPGDRNPPPPPTTSSNTDKRRSVCVCVCVVLDLWTIIDAWDPGKFDGQKRIPINSRHFPLCGSVKGRNPTSLAASLAHMALTRPDTQSTHRTLPLSHGSTSSPAHPPLFPESGLTCFQRVTRRQDSRFCLYPEHPSPSPSHLVGGASIIHRLLRSPEYRVAGPCSGSLFLPAGSRLERDSCIREPTATLTSHGLVDAPLPLGVLLPRPGHSRKTLE
ncbi:hypothetical protein NHX12_007462 [Muraenolepis orangiensis]|uniref:Uncharacterized protein n=1 Tax=Muraenolepis orangiensis TaxID=630683 RepID=A0A9Q0DP65_9TELE|nr:hypothetical protein NHX12_007462 [Muraenolepis orangiensis]